MDDRDDLQNRWKPSIELDQKPAIVVRQLDPALAPCAARRSIDVGAPHSLRQAGFST
jgi:hypothetical protein